MNHWMLWTLAAAGCTISVEDKSGDGSETTDPTTPTTEPDPDPTTDPETTDPETTDTTDPEGGSIAACAGLWLGEYGGAEQGNFEATLDAVAMSVEIVDVAGSGVLDGVLGLDADGALYGENQGFWMEGQLDTETCVMSGDWGVTSLPNVAAGWWATDN